MPQVHRLPKHHRHYAVNKMKNRLSHFVLIDSGKRKVKVTITPEGEVSMRYAGHTKATDPKLELKLLDVWNKQNGELPLT